MGTKRRRLEGGCRTSYAARYTRAAEREAIKARRHTYGVKSDREYATGLALSGGGIRSATFSLGVLIALARRNLLPDFDYRSTVWGGGYLGSFLTTFLSTTGDATESRVQILGLRATQRPFLKEVDGESYRAPRSMPESNKSALAKGGKNKDS